MNKIFISSILFICLFLTTSCDKVSQSLEAIEDGIDINKGTLIKYSNCLKNNKDQGLSEKVVEKLCREKHTQDITHKVDITGKAGYNFYFGQDFSGNLENKSLNYVVTSVELLVKNKENKTGEKMLVNGLWIQPASNEDFEYSALKFIPDKETYDSKDTSWMIISVKGLRVKLQ